MIYAIDSKMSYNEYSMLENKSLNQWEWPLEEPISIDPFPLYAYNKNYKWWLCGFTEAEGCFCIRKSGAQSFSIGQKNDRIIIESIKTFFKLPNKIRTQKQTKFFIIETYNTRSLYQIINFFEQYSLRGEKSGSFQLFKNYFNSK
jgi:hypothetical protein